MTASFCDESSLRLSDNPPALAGAENPPWSPDKAAASLDARALLWTASEETKRSHDTTCVSCHSVAPYLLVRPLLTGEDAFISGFMSDAASAFAALALAGR